MRRFRVLGYCVVGGLLFNFIWVILDIIFPLRLYIPYSQQVYAADSVLLRTFLSPDDKWRLPASLNEISPELKQFIIYKEDRYFYYHPGINPIAILRAAWQNTLRNKRVSGASTITMQTIRLLEPRKRTYLAKCIEVFRAFQMELYYTKAEILSIYLNLIPAGSNIEGVKAAAYLYFGRSPQSLSLAQCVTLAILPNRPNSLRPGRRDYALLQARNHWLKRAKYDHLFNQELIDAALSEPPDCYRRPPPNEAPQLAIRLVQAHPNEAVIYSTIQAQMQRKAQLITRNYVRRIRHTGISNAAVMVFDNQTKRVVAYVGSADFENKIDNGENDGVQAIRSPGSTLKPYLFAAATDAGHITAQTMLLDAPVNFSGYAPENYDETCYGNISAAFALSNSLNIPAVKLLHQYGVQEFCQKLERSGIPIAKRSKKLGLSMILGGCGVKLEELIGLYASFASGGAYQPLIYTSKHAPQLTTKLLTPAAAYITSEILTQLRRPDLPYNYQYAPDLPKIAWKTGTSYGRRDAWSIGFTPQYTIGVWVGNFDGTSNPALSGAEIATPLLFGLFRAFSTPAAANWFQRPQGLGTRAVCSFSGLVPGKHCIDKITDDYIIGISSAERCQHLLPVWVNDSQSISYCGACVPLTGVVQKLYSNLSPALIVF